MEKSVTIPNRYINPLQESLGSVKKLCEGKPNKRCVFGAVGNVLTWRESAYSASNEIRR